MLDIEVAILVLFVFSPLLVAVIYQASKTIYSLVRRKKEAEKT